MSSRLQLPLQQLPPHFAVLPSGPAFQHTVGYRFYSQASRYKRPALSDPCKPTAGCRWSLICQFVAKEAVKSLAGSWRGVSVTIKLVQTGARRTALLKPGIDVGYAGAVGFRTALSTAVAS